MSDTVAALAAAGILYDKSDFANPHLDGPTALTATADGRVYGHLTAWGTPHIGNGCTRHATNVAAGRQVLPPGCHRDDGR